VLGVLGVLFLGHMGMLAKVLVLGAWPVAALGAWRLSRPLESTLARLSAVIAYLAVPLPYNSLARGRWTGLLAYAAMPWVLAQLARMCDLEPFGTRRPRRRAYDDPPAWRPVLQLGVLLAAVAVFAPAIVLAAVVAALGLVVGSVLAGGAGRALGALRGALGAAVVAVVVLLPWSVALAVPGGWSTVAGVGRTAGRSPGLGALLRFQVGPLGAGVLGWALLAAAALPLLVAREWRFAWAVRFWGVALVSVGVAWAGGRGWLPLRLQDPDVLLAVAAAALAGAVAMGAAASQVDLRGYRFSWRQAAPLAGGVALLAAVLPVVGAAPDGGWGVTSSEITRSVGWMPAQAAQGAFRVLWIGDPEVLPLDAWPLEAEPGVAYATSRNGSPNVADLWPGPPSGATRSMGDALQIARQGGTARLGRLLAPMAVRYIVVPKRLSTGEGPDAAPVPAALTRALGSQLDLRVLPSDPAVDVYENVSWGPGRALVPASLPNPLPAALGAGADLSGGQPVLGGTGPVRFTGQIAAPGTVLVSESPSGRWELTVRGQAAPRSDAFGVANAFTNGQSGSAKVRYRTPLLFRPLALVPFVLWGFAAALLWRSRRRPVEREADTQLMPILTATGA
jgi:hypothetical protein